MTEPPTLARFTRAPSALLAQRDLLARVDRKFITHRRDLPAFLAGLGEHYQVLTAGDARWARYETRYFDTPELSSFYEHLRGRRPRFKVRLRRHVDRDRSFLEIKQKTNGGRTEKVRMSRATSVGDLSAEEEQFVVQNSPFEMGELLPVVWTNFQRATFLGVNTNERLTIDLGLTFEADGQVGSREELVIIELKQGRLSHATPAAKLLRNLGIREGSMSKYCAGVALLRDEARPRLRKLALRRMERIGV